MTPDRDAAALFVDDPGADLRVDTAAWPVPTVPEPRPEVLARVLEGLRSLPPRPEQPSTGLPVGPDVPAVPLPRRCL